MEAYRAIVVGGGVVGCNILYHLAKLGWDDIALLERRELTSGATWHSSGHVAHYTADPKLVELAAYTRQMLRALQDETGQDIGLHECGSQRLITRPEQADEFQQFANTANAMDLDVRLLGADETRALWPLMNADDVLGSMFVPQDCTLNPADLTQALAKAARGRGAKIMRDTEVIGIAADPLGGWRLDTARGPFRCEHVIMATGIFARRSCAMAGIELPVAVLSHQYIVTAPVDEIAERRRSGQQRMPILRQPDMRLNVREEAEGLFVSMYEANAKAIYRNGPPADLGMELLPPDFESIEDQFEGAVRRVPCLGEAGIKDVVHGPLPWSVDFAPIVGPMNGRENLWVAEGVSYGITWSGGVARDLAHWIVHGDPGRDVSAIDCRRFGPYPGHDAVDEGATRSYRGSYNNEATR